MPFYAVNDPELLYVFLGISIEHFRFVLTTSFRTICAVDRKTKCMKVGDAHILDSSKRIFALSGLTNAQVYILTRTWLIKKFH